MHDFELETTLTSDFNHVVALNFHSPADTYPIEESEVDAEARREKGTQRRMHFAHSFALNGSIVTRADLRKLSTKLDRT